ncbi:hypothetical protein CMK22_14860 [Candidatus Poribacteria bacterium]|nr:hypothetical protein [Candidatus Poribacteria bacterium]
MVAIGSNLVHSLDGVIYLYRFKGNMKCKIFIDYRLRVATAICGLPTQIAIFNFLHKLITIPI